MGSNISKRAGQPLALSSDANRGRGLDEVDHSGQQHASVRIGTSGSARRERWMPYATAMPRSNRKARLSFTVAL
jgi:hypothetical protein